MTTVASRTFKSSPARSAHDTWMAIIELLSRGKINVARTELAAVSGIASSIISDRFPKDAPIVVTCEGPRTRIYCLYDDEAVEGSDANEEPLGFDPLNGDWRVSLPCDSENLSWARAALKKHGERITARDLSATVGTSDSSKKQNGGLLEIDPKGFLGHD